MRGYKVVSNLQLLEVDMEQKTLTLTELAKYIGIGRRTLYVMILEDRFPVPPIKGTDPRRWSVEAVDKWIADSEGGDDTTRP